MRKTNACFSVVALLLTACLTIGCRQRPADKGTAPPNGTTEAKTTPPTATVAGTKTAADVTVESVAYAEEYKKDKAAHQAKYKGKRIALQGVVCGMGCGLSDEAFLLLAGAKGDLIGVQCVTIDKQPWKKAMPGQTVTLLGSYPAFSAGAGLCDCEIDAVTGPQPDAFTADALLKAHQADPEGTAKKYEDKFIRLTGEIAKVDINDMGAAAVVLKTAAAKPALTCAFDAFQKNSNKDFKPGQTLTALGQIGFATDDVLNIGNCMLLEVK